MNRKGFTLVELLAVVTILLAISIVTITSVTASLERGKDQNKTTQENMIKNAAKIYFSNNTSEGVNLMLNGSCVNISVLIDYRYIDGDSIDESYKTGSVKQESTGYSIKDTLCS